MELAGIKPGHRVLDVATFTAARRVGATGSVLGIAIAPEMIAIAREEAARLGIGNIEIREIDAERPEQRT